MNDAALSPKQIEFLTHLLARCTVTRAARKTSIHRSTVYLWLNEDPAFRAEYDRLHAVLAGSLADRLRELRIEALDAPEDALAGPESTPAVRLRAAIYVLGDGPGQAGPLDKPVTGTVSGTRTKLLMTSPSGWI